MTIQGDKILYDLSGSYSYIGCFLNVSSDTSFSTMVGGTKAPFSKITLNSVCYSVLETRLPESSVVNAALYPIAFSGFCSDAYEKIMNAIFELWSNLVPEQAIDCYFNMGFFLVGGRDKHKAYNNKN